MAFACKDLILKKQLIGQILIKRNLITIDQLEEALEIQKRNGGFVGDILVDLKYVTERDIVVALIVQCGFPYIAVNKYKIDPKVAELIPEAVARRFHIVPLDCVGDVLSVVMVNPLNVSMVEELENTTKRKIATFIATKTEINEAIGRWYKKGVS